jgi:hypothetical protein
VVGQHRSTQLLEVALVSDDEQKVRSWLVKFAMKNPRWG